MPQMAPVLWLPVALATAMCLMLALSMSYFYPTSLMNTLDSKYNNFCATNWPW
nr:TPA_asm: ATP8 [Baikalogammarus pullus]